MTPEKMLEAARALAQATQEFQDNDHGAPSEKILGAHLLKLLDHIAEQAEKIEILESEAISNKNDIDDLEHSVAVTEDQVERLAQIRNGQQKEIECLKEALREERALIITSIRTRKELHPLWDEIDRVFLEEEIIDNDIDEARKQLAQEMPEIDFGGKDE